MALCVRALVTLSLLCGLAQAEPVRVRLAEIRPSQVRIGKAIVNRYVKKWEKRAKKADISISEYLTKVEQPEMERKRLDAIIDPKGAVRNADGHHRLAAMLQLQEREGLDLHLTLEVKKDYRGWKQRQYAEHLVRTLGKAHFTPELDKLSPQQRVAQLPDRYRDLKDDPLRSAVGHLFDRLDVKTASLVDYAEFKVGDVMLTHGLYEKLAERGIRVGRDGNLPARLLFGRRVQTVLAEMLVQGEVREAFLAQAVDAQARASLETLLDRAAKQLAR